MSAFRLSLVFLPGLLVVLAAGTICAEETIPDPMELLLQEVLAIRNEPFRCDTTGEFPNQRLTGDDDDLRRLCECETCRRWARHNLFMLSTLLSHGNRERVLKTVKMILLGASTDQFACEKQQRQRAEDLGVLHDWIEYRYGRRAIWPDRCALSGIPPESRLYVFPYTTPLCSCEACLRWAYDTLHALSVRVVAPLAEGKQDEALAGIDTILEQTQGSDRRPPLPNWYRQVVDTGDRDYRCDSTGEHPEKTLLADDVERTKKLCQCDSCQRWASKALPGAVLPVREARRGNHDDALERLMRHVRMSDRDSVGARMRERERAQKLGVLDEWIEFRYGRRATWPDVHCAVTNLPSETPLQSMTCQLCRCDNCQQWAFATLRELRVRVIAPLLAREKEKALAALKEIAGEEEPPRQPIPPQPML